MRAVRYAGAGNADVATLVEEAPPIPSAGEVQVEVVAAGINRADISQREGHYPPPKGTTDIPGLEVSGVVSAVGTGVTGFEVGDRVCALLAGGGYAETVVVSADLVLPVPETLDLVEAAALPEAIATVFSCLHRAAGMRAGDTVLVHGGAGGIGSMAIQLGRALGVTVLATASGHADRLRELGAHAVIDYRSEDVPARVRELTGGAGVDIVLDILGASALEANLACLAIGGRIVVIGQQGGERSAPIDLGRLMAKRQSVLGLTLRARPLAEKADIMRGVRDEIWPLVESGGVVPLVGERYPLEQVADAQRHLERSGGHFGKILLTTGKA